MKDRLKEPSSYAGLGLVFNGISQCLSGDYQTGALNIILGLVAVFKTEGAKLDELSITWVECSVLRVTTIC